MEDKKKEREKEKRFFSILVAFESWTNFNLQDEPWAEFSTLEVAACKPCTYCPV
jgi:hypothetical protein